MIDPKLSKDVKTITLSYTFFEVGGKTPRGARGRQCGRHRAGGAALVTRAPKRRARARCGAPSRRWPGRFFGVRKNSDYQEDIAKLNPLHIIAVGLVAVVAVRRSA